MNPGVRYLATSLALALVATGYFVLQTRSERPGPPRPAAARSGPRPPLPAPPPSARDVLDRADALDLRGDQRASLEALHRRWQPEIAGLEAAVHESEREFSRFMQEARGSGGARMQDIQRRAAEFGQLSAELRERRQRHSDAALRVLADWQRERLKRSSVIEGRANEPARH